MTGAQRILVLDPEPGLPAPDALRAHLADRGAVLTVCPVGDGAPPPPASLAGFDGLVVMGGAAMVTERPDWMAPVQALQSEAAAEGLPQLAVCLGAQMLADALGGQVDWHPEGRLAFGYAPVRALPAPDNPVPDGLVVLSGNSQGFSPPPGAESLATSAIWPEQAFRIGRSLALQFHPEVTRPILTAWQRLMPENHARPGGQPKAVQDADFAAHDAALKAWLRSLLDRWFDLGRPWTRGS